jgi:HpiC1 cyclase
MTLSPLESGATSGRRFSASTCGREGTARVRPCPYDSLNRITGALTASTYAASPAHCWGEAYGLDAWGNLNSIGATTTSGYTGCTQESGFSVTADGNNHLPLLGYYASGNTANDGPNSYTYNAESQIKTVTNSGGTFTYLYGGSGRRVAKIGNKLYWYGSGGEILAESDASGNTLNEYIFFVGRRLAIIGSGSLPVQNSSFETYNTLNQSCGSINCYNFGPIPSWTSSGAGPTGSWQPNASYNFPLLYRPTVAYSNGGSISQTLTGFSLQPNSTYKLTVAIGHRLDGLVANYSLSLQAGSTVLATVTAPMGLSRRAHLPM